MIVKTKDLREKSPEELAADLANFKTELFQAKMAFHSRKLENSSLMKTLRKSIAQINTIVQERSQEANQENV